MKGRLLSGQPRAQLSQAEIHEITQTPSIARSVGIAGCIAWAVFVNDADWAGRDHGLGLISMLTDAVSAWPLAGTAVTVKVCRPDAIWAVPVMRQVIVPSSS